MPASEYTVTYTPNVDDFVAGAEQCAEFRPRWAIAVRRSRIAFTVIAVIVSPLLIVLPALLIRLFYGAAQFDKFGDAEWVILVTLGVLLAIMVLRKLTSLEGVKAVRMRAMKRGAREFFTPRPPLSVRISAEGVRWTSSALDAVAPWGAFDIVKSDPFRVFLRHEVNITIVVPRSSFKDPAQADEFADASAGWWKAAKASTLRT